MGRKNLHKWIREEYVSLRRYGESRHDEKQSIREDGTYKFGYMSKYIYSIKTSKTYEEIGRRYADWLVNEKGVSKWSSLSDIDESYAKEYLDKRIEDNVSAYTFKAERSALGKLYGHTIEYDNAPIRERDNIIRSRGDAERDRHFSEEKNQTAVDLTRACGFRRSDLSRVRSSDFEERDGHLVVRVEGSKGGRDRISPVRPELENRVREILHEHKAAGRTENERLVDKVHNAMDVHSYRRDYAQGLYEDVTNDRDFRDRVLDLYEQRYEPKAKGDMYYTRGENQFSGERDDIYCVTQALGHNRLDVTVNHYLR